MTTRTQLSPVYSIRPGHALKRAAVEAMLQFGGIADRAPLWLVVAIPLILPFIAFTLFPIGMLLSLLLLVVSPFLVGFWHERRLRRAAIRICTRRLCLGCGYPLLNACAGADGAGVCPECGRPFHVGAYASDESNLPCAGCGYDLRSLVNISRACPECGASIE